MNRRKLKWLQLSKLEQAAHARFDRRLQNGCDRSLIFEALALLQKIEVVFAAEPAPMVVSRHSGSGRLPCSKFMKRQPQRS